MAMVPEAGRSGLANSSLLKQPNTFADFLRVAPRVKLKRTKGHSRYFQSLMEMRAPLIFLPQAVQACSSIAFASIKNSNNSQER